MIYPLMLAGAFLSSAQSERVAWPFIIRAIEGRGILSLEMELTPLEHVGLLLRVRQKDEYRAVARILLATAETEWDSGSLGALSLREKNDDGAYSRLIRQALLATGYRSESLYVSCRILSEGGSVDSKASAFAVVTVGNPKKVSEAKLVFLSKDGVVLQIVGPK